MEKKSLIKRKVKSCRRSSLVDNSEHIKNVRLSLGKVSEKTKFRSSSFDIFVG